MKLTDRNGNIFIPNEDLQRLHDGVRILISLRIKYFKLGKIISSSDFPADIKNQFFSFGREMEKLLSLWDKFGEV